MLAQETAASARSIGNKRGRMNYEDTEPYMSAFLN
jgi:hypothetical protein